jgi:hypothetical protein
MKTGPLGAADREAVGHQAEYRGLLVDENRFWSLIESAWRSAGGKTAERRRLAAGRLPESQAFALEDALDEVIPALKAQLDRLSAEELLAFDRILERKLYDIDRAEVHEHTDGSDDGFLYARGFIVAAGQWYYDAVNVTPAVALAELECEEMCYLSWQLYQYKFRELSPSGISRESCSNQAGWPILD